MSRQQHSFDCLQLNERLFGCSLFYETQVLDCLLDVMGNVLYPNDVELALGLFLFHYN